MCGHGAGIVTEQTSGIFSLIQIH